MRKASGFKIPGILFLAYPFIEITIFVLVCRLIGVLGALALLVATTMLGSYLLRRAGFTRNQGPLAFMQLQSVNMFQIFAGFLLTLPGFFTDALGLLLLFPPLQRFFLRKITKVTPQAGTAAANDSNEKGRTIEGEYWRDDEST